ncbi:MAG: LysR family transcriptional regulator [Desulfosporosinus sp.]|nr:LysR family transcriptional regulator [Desulfosporosinus sp.]
MYYLGIQAFLAIVQEKNLKHAAESLFLSPSTVGYRLKTLEQELGVKLIERNKGGDHIRMTPSGENFVNLAERWNTLWNETQMFQSAGAQMSINISAPNSLNMYVLPPLYRALYQHVPSIRYWVHTEHTEEAVEGIVKKEMDVAFLGREMPLPASLVLEPFIEEEMMLLRLATPERNSLEIIDIRSLDPEYELYWKWGSNYQQWHDQRWDPTYPRRVRVDMAELFPALMVDSKQWAIVVNSVGQWIAQSGKFILQKLSEKPPNRLYYKLMHRYPTPSAAQSLGILNHYLEKLFKEKKTT